MHMNPGWDFVFAGYLIVKRFDSLMLTPDDMAYRGPDRASLSTHLDTNDVTMPAGWQQATSEQLRAAEDVFGLIARQEDVEQILATVNAHDNAYDVIACCIEGRALDHLFTKDVADVLALPDTEDVEAFLRARNRLSRRPKPPDGKVLGYDVATLGPIVHSVVFRGILPAVEAPFAPYRPLLNGSGLLPDIRIAHAVLADYMRLASRDIGDCYVYEVRDPLLHHASLTRNKN